VLRSTNILLLLAALLLTWSCKEEETSTPDEAPIKTRARAEPEPEPDPGGPSEPNDFVAEAPPTEPAPIASDEVRISISPVTLDVLQTNTVRLSAVLPADRPGAACRWILSGGADEAVHGCEAGLHVPDAAADIDWILVVTDGETEVLRRDGAIPLERLHVGEGAVGEWGLQAHWSVSPCELGVLQDTEVVLAADAPEGAVCTWDTGDGAAPRPGCRISVLFREAHADRTVTLTVRLGGDLLYSGARVLPLERLPMTRRFFEPEADLPICGEGCRRLAVAAVSGGGLDRAYALATGTGAEALVLFLHEPLPAASALEDLARHLGALKTALLPVACGDGLGRSALTTLLTDHALPAGMVLHSDMADLPARYAVQWGSAFLAALPTRADIHDERWLTEQLETAAMFRTRILVSCRGFDRLTGADPPLLPSPYRQYEKMRRGGLQLFISGAHEAFYPGTYGNLRTLSPGRVQGPSAALLGQEDPQGPAAALVDIDENRIQRLVGVVPAGDGWARLPEETLPEKVGVYRRWR